MSFIENGDMASFWKEYDTMPRSPLIRDSLIRNLLGQISLEDLTLFPTHRKLLKYRYIEAMSSVQIAKRLGISLVSVGSTHYQAIRALRELTTRSMTAVLPTNASDFWQLYDQEKSLSKKKSLLTRYLSTLVLDSYPDLSTINRKILELIRDGADLANLRKAFNWEFADMAYKKSHAIGTLRTITIGTERCQWQTPQEFWSLYEQKTLLTVKCALLRTFLQSINLETLLISSAPRELLERLRNGEELASIFASGKNQGVQKFRAIVALKIATLEVGDYATRSEFWELFDRSSFLGRQKLLTRFLTEVESEGHIHDELTDEEWRLLQLVATGERGKAIKKILGYAEGTISKKRRKAIEHLRVLTTSRKYRGEIVQ